MEKGLTISLIRGLSRESGHWGEFLTFLQKEMPRAELRLLDLPGSGVHNKKRSPLSVSKIVDFLRKENNLNTNDLNIVVASSLGGMVAMEWVSKYPDDFDGIVTMNSSFNEICSNSERVKSTIRPELFKAMFYTRLRNREKAILKINSNKIDHGNKVLNRWIDIQKKRRMTRWNIVSQAFAGIRYTPKQVALHIPLLMLGSKMDKMVCMECIEKSHKVFGGQLVWHETAGHCIPLDEPEWVTQEIHKWLQRTNLI
jgi:pimeloyl-ACP methyl ester carboxylesterase